MRRNLALFHKLPLGKERIEELSQRYQCPVIRVHDYDILKGREILYAENRTALNLELYSVTSLETYFKRIQAINYRNLVGHFRSLLMTRVVHSSMRLLIGEWECNMRGQQGSPEVFPRMLVNDVNGSQIMQELITIDVKLPKVVQYPGYGIYPEDR